MAEFLGLYKCDICDNVVETTHQGVGQLVCCGQDMRLLSENISEVENLHYAFLEKIDEITKKIFLKHPMTKEHYIEFIEVISNDKKYIKRKHFNFDEPLELTFKCNCLNGFYVRIYCNKDGVWTTKEIN